MGLELYDWRIAVIVDCSLTRALGSEVMCIISPEYAVWQWLVVSKTVIRPCG